MDLEHANQTHMEWKARFRFAILAKDTLDAEMISKDDCCELGKWLFGAGKSELGSLVNYADCVVKHKTFHIEAGKVAAAINAKKYAEAGAMIAPGAPYSMASNMTVFAIAQLREESRRARPA